MDQPLVSVVIMTYNHENYITQALEGVIAQRVNFPMELLVTNDCSTDRTAQVIDEYVSKTKTDVDIRVFHLKKNVGLTANHCFIVKQANGKYISYCDGDDYWTDPYKLQHQIDYMEAHPECALCYHNALVENGNVRWPFVSINKRSGVVPIEEVVKIWAIPTSAVVYRREYIAGEEDRIIKYANEDYAVEIFMLTKGECHYDDSIYGVINRKHPESVSAEMNRKPIKMYEDLIAFLEDAKQWHPKDKHHSFDEAIGRYKEYIRKINLNIKYPFLKYFRPSRYRHWLIQKLSCK